MKPGLERSPNLFVGIDVAFAKRKRLPICVAYHDGGRLVPIASRAIGLADTPRGHGNVATLEAGVVAQFAEETLDWLRAIERALGGQIATIAIDAPSSYSHSGRRECEKAMDAMGISCFATPTAERFTEIKEKVRRHLDAGGAVNRLPHANQLWMLVGFALFETLATHYQCLEVFPQATVRVLGAADIHKFKRGGAEAQLACIAEQTGWSASDLSHALAAGVAAPLHDRVDAFVCAWVASLYPGGLTPCGRPPDDVIWVPRLDGLSIVPRKS